MNKLIKYRGHIRNHKALCLELDIDNNLPREKREEEIILKAYEKWGCDMGNHMHGMFAFALYNDETDSYFCLRDQFGTKPFYYYRQ